MFRMFEKKKKKKRKRRKKRKKKAKEKKRKRRGDLIPDRVLINKENQTYQLIDLSVPTNHRK